MTEKEIAGLEKELETFLSQFDDCFARSGSRENLKVYVSGQLSDLPRKSVEPMALRAKMPPRTLQMFLYSAKWQEDRTVDRLQWIVAGDHADARSIGIVDESGNPKKGTHTVGVQRQWCGATGKKDNCVVGVHLGYAAGDFHCLLDSDIYLPQSWANDPAGRRQAWVPEAVAYRKKSQIALDQIRRAISNGIRFWSLTFDEWYGRDGEFLDGLESLGQNYVGEVPSNFTGWLKQPEILIGPMPEDRYQRGPKGHFPRLSKKALPASQVRNLVKYSRIFQSQRWQAFHIKDGEKGPMVWEAKYAGFYRKDSSGLPGRAHWLIAARNVLNRNEIKYFVSNFSPDTPIKTLLSVAFSRWPIEQCFEQAKKELGLDHFEVRSWPAIHRHYYATQISHLFCSRIHQRLRKKTTESFYLTVEQVRLAACVCIEAKSLSPSVRKKKFCQTAEIIAYYQRRNRQARISHTRKTLHRLKCLGIKVHQLPSCV